MFIGSAGIKRVTEMADPDMAASLFPSPNSGELPISKILLEQQQAIEQLTAAVEETNAKAEAALELGKDVAGAI